jgi:hypothetical protein
LALLTHVDSLDLITKEDMTDIYNYSPVKSKVIHKQFFEEC